jgi:4-amino-4-deoxy-L-arabinose transferase-like glycosyltransferase
MTNAPFLNEWRLSRFSLAVLLIFGLSLMLIHLGDRRVLTRHEVLAAQPAREMFHQGDWHLFVLPTLAGVRREIKPPGMMWLIAGSIYVFRSESEWVARLPSALAAVLIAILIGKLAARWFGDRIGRLAGLMQLTFVYTLMQGKLSEADMSMAAAVCCALYVFAAGVIDSPVGLETGRSRRIMFWLAIAAAFLIKGPIGPLFVFLTVLCFVFLRRRGHDAKLDWRPLRFLADPVGIALCAIPVIGWPLIAWCMDPSILHVWNSETIGRALGKFGSEPFYYYVWSVPVMMLPWAPLAVIGLWRGPNAELAGPVVRQADRAMFWRFLLSWFVPGIIFLSFCVRMKHHHYPIPILPPLTIPAALGLDYYIRRQTSRAQGFVWPFFLGGCAVAAAVVWLLHSIDPAMKRPIITLIGLFAIGGLLSLHFERTRRPGAVLASYFLIAWALGVGVQSWLMPVQDDFHYQKDLAITANGMVPPGDTIYLLGHREEEQEAQYSYYLRFPMQRLTSAADFAARMHDGPVYAIAPADYIPEIAGTGHIETLAVCGGLHRGDRAGDRLQLLRITANPSTDKS